MATETDIANLALGKIGGAGEALTGNAFITDINGSDKVSTWCKLNFPRVRRRVIKDAAVGRAPFRSTLRFADLGAELADFPEIGTWTHAFNLPADSLLVINQFAEDLMAARRQPSDYTSNAVNLNYQWEAIANSDGTGLILLTDTLSNSDQDSAFIEYVIDTPNTASFNEEMIECIATLLASGVAPIVGANVKVSDEQLAKYLQVALPAAKAANQNDFNSSARPIANYNGGRNEVIRGLW